MVIFQLFKITEKLQKLAKWKNNVWLNNNKNKREKKSE